MQYFNNLYKGRYILINLVRQDLKNRYRNSIFGVAWTFLTPLGLVLIIGLVYSIVFGQPMKSFVPFLFSGLIPWIYFSSCADGGTMSFLSAQGYIKQTQVPIEIFPVRIALGAFVNLLLSIIAFIIIYLFISPEKFGFEMFMAIPALLIWLVLGSACATLTAIINIYIRDFSPLQALILQGLFYITPIIYPVEMLAGKNYSWIYLLNPFYYMLDIIRNPLLGNSIPELRTWIICISFMLMLLIAAIFFIEKIGRKITFRL